MDEKEEMQIILSNVKKGHWTASISYAPEEVVESLLVFYCEKKPSGKWHNCDKLIAVDSAQAGIFDLTAFGREDAIKFEVKNVHDILIDEIGIKYFAVCFDNVATDVQGGVVPGGAVNVWLW